MSSDREAVLQAYRLMDEHADGDVGKALSAWNSARRRFQEAPAFANANLALFDEGLRKLRAIVVQCEWSVAADALTEAEILHAQIRARSRG